MRKSKIHFEQIPVETVRKIAKKFPAKLARGNHRGCAGTLDEVMSSRERWREVAQKVQREESPKKMIGPVQRFMGAFDVEQLHKRLPCRRNPRKQSADSGEDQS